jgi:hypothetical protein
MFFQSTNLKRISINSLAEKRPEDIGIDGGVFPNRGDYTKFEFVAY